MNQNNEKYPTMQLGYRIIIFLCAIAFIKALLVDKNFSMAIIIGLAIIFIIFIDQWLVDVDNANNNTNNNTEPDSINDLKIEGFDRTDRLEWLNKDRGKLGQFYVNCHGCGRKKIL